MRILILGSTGFVGRNIAEILSPHFSVILTSRKPYQASNFTFDLADRTTWASLAELNPDVVINAAAYGVIKHEKDLEMMYAVNYLFISEFYTFIRSLCPSVFWFQIGTAFEYDIDREGGIDEQSPCLPRTHYGISKLMMSRFLIERGSLGDYSILRPFGMFGKYEDESKFFPMLMHAQQMKQAIKLSAGSQQRDYFFVEDLGLWIKQRIEKAGLRQLPPLVNLGSGKAMSLREYAGVLGKIIPGFDSSLWIWNALDFRANESGLFFNSSTLASQLEFNVTELSKAFLKTMDHRNEFKR